MSLEIEESAKSMWEELIAAVNRDRIPSVSWGDQSNPGTLKQRTIVADFPNFSTYSHSDYEEWTPGGSTFRKCETFENRSVERFCESFSESNPIFKSFVNDFARISHSNDSNDFFDRFMGKVVLYDFTCSILGSILKGKMPKWSRTQDSLLRQILTENIHVTSLQDFSTVVLKRKKTKIPRRIRLTAKRDGITVAIREPKKSDFPEFLDGGHLSDSGDIPKDQRSQHLGIITSVAETRLDAKNVPLSMIPQDSYFISTPYSYCHLREFDVAFDYLFWRRGEVNRYLELCQSVGVPKTQIYAYEVYVGRRLIYKEFQVADLKESSSPRPNIEIDPNRNGNFGQVNSEFRALFSKHAIERLYERDYFKEKVPVSYVEDSNLRSAYKIYSEVLSSRSEQIKEIHDCFMALQKFYAFKENKPETYIGLLSLLEMLSLDTKGFREFFCLSWCLRSTYTHYDAEKKRIESCLRRFGAKTRSSLRASEWAVDHEKAAEELEEYVGLDVSELSYVGSTLLELLRLTIVSCLNSDKSGKEFASLARARALKEAIRIDKTTSFPKSYMPEQFARKLRWSESGSSDTEHLCT